MASTPLPTLSASSLSTDSSHALLAPAPPPSALRLTPAHLLADKYDLSATFAHLTRLNPPVQNVALQFPDELLGDSVAVFREIQACLDRAGSGGRAWVLGDTTYGSCCIDSLSALHISADALVHYGHACLTPCSDPALLNRIRYVFPKLPLDVSLCASAISKLAGEQERVLVVHEVGYDWAMVDLEREVRTLEKGTGTDGRTVFSRINLQDQDVKEDEIVRQRLETSRIDGPELVAASGGCCSTRETVEFSSTSSCCGGNTSSPLDPSPSSSNCCQQPDSDPTQSSSCCSSSLPPRTPLQELTATTSSSLRSYQLPEGTTLEDFTVFFIGPEESLGLRNLLVTHSKNAVYSYSPSEHAESIPEEPVQLTLQSTKTNRLLMRRYATMFKAREADVFGLLVGNVNLAGSLPLLKHLRALLKKKHKKTYTVSVGKLNPAKLANFAEVECFVLVACGENTLVDSKEFYRPIITPYELELALQDEPQWGAQEYVLDFTKLLPEGGPTDEQAPPAPTDGDAAQAKQAEEEQDDDDDQPIFSTVTGTYRHPKRYGTTTTTTSAAEQSTSLTLRSTDDAVIHTNLPRPSELWKGRTWVGLDPRVGLDKVGVLEEGRGGRAWNYEEEKESKAE